MGPGAAIDTTATCRRCGGSLTYVRTGRPRIYCSAACRSGRRIDQLRASREPVRCRRCGSPIDLRPSGGRVRTTYCSDACKERTRSARQRAERQALHGERTCRQCGQPIPLEVRADTYTCSRSCGVRYENTLRAERARAARSLRSRPPCLVCGAAIDPARRLNVIYCTEACKRIAVATKYRARNPDAQLARYQMGPGEYVAMLAAQGGGCAICGATEPGGKGGRFHVDHDHATGRVRGLLCHGCNLGIGMLRDDPAVLLAAIHYLERLA